MNKHVKCQSFTLLLNDIDLINATKKRCMLMGIDTNKSEIMRAGIAALKLLNDKQLSKLIAALPKIKAGRPFLKK